MIECFKSLFEPKLRIFVDFSDFNLKYNLKLIVELEKNDTMKSPLHDASCD